MIMSLKLRWGMVTAIAMGSAQLATASSVSAFLGQAQNPADATCFSNAAGGVKNTCATPRRFCVALPVSTTTAAVTVNAQAAAATAPVQCFANSVTRYAGSFMQTNMFSTIGTAATPIFLPSVSIPANGALYTCCDLPTNSSVFTINW
jgi:hypothetical protein